MADTAAHLVDRVIPRVPVRQWGVSFPRQVRYSLARDARLLSGLVRIFAAEVSRFYRRKSGLPLMKDALTGGVTAVQRFGGSLNLNVHLHTIFLDGAYGRDGPGGSLRFHKAPEPEPDETQAVLERVRRRGLKFLAKNGVWTGPPGEGGGEELHEVPTAMDVLQAGSIRGWEGMTDRPAPIEVAGRDASRPPVPRREDPFAAEREGWSLHCGVRITAGDRGGLEQLCRYLLRPAFAEERPSRLSDGRILYRFRRPWPDGTSHVALDPVDFVGKLAALVSPPRSHTVRYPGCWGPIPARERRGWGRSRWSCRTRNPRHVGTPRGRASGRSGRS